jgi:hypothetical protein
MRKATVTLLTDFGLADSYVAAMKGVILNINPSATIVDISHDTPPQDVLHAGYLLFSSYRYFPRGTVHVIVVDPGVGTARKILCLETEDFYFLAPDNGVLTFIVNSVYIKKIVNVTNRDYFLKPLSRTFHGRDIFAPVAAHLSRGISLEKLGRQARQIKKIDLPKPKVTDEGLQGIIIHIDRFGNLITNISKGDFDKFRRGRPQSEIRIQVKSSKGIDIRDSYACIRKNSPSGIWGSSGMLEISLNQGDASRILKAKRLDKLTCYRS